MSKTKTYDAFISYSHADCGNIAPVIQKAVENIGKPWYRLGRNLNVFRDETNLAASPGLWPTIEKALANSDHFIFFASPLAVSSKWVSDELSVWIQKNYTSEAGLTNISIVLTEGKIAWDKEKNDFDWTTTDCLPKEILSGKFPAEPLWIDLRPYVRRSQRGREVLYKVSGFTAAMTRIIGAILGKSPREIESDELRRRNRTVSFITVFFLALLSAVILIFSLVRQKRFEEKVSLSNSLIGEGNKESETNISRALLFYHYAYLENPDSSNFRILNEFYERNVFFDDYVDYFDMDGDTVPKPTRHDTLSKFFSLVHARDKQQRIPYLCIPASSYFLISRDTLETINYLTGKTEITKIKGIDSLTFVSNPYCSVITFYDPVFDNKKPEKTLIRYDLKSKKREVISLNFSPHRLDEYNNLFYGDCSANGKFILFCPERPESTSPKDWNDIPFYFYEADKNVLSLKKVRVANESTNGQIKASDISGDGLKFYFKYGSTAEGADFHNDNYIVDMNTSSVEKKMKEGDYCLATDVIEPTKFSWGKKHDYYLYGNKGGQLFLSRGEKYTEQMSSYPGTLHGEISQVAFSSKYIFTGTTGGLVSVWRNCINDEYAFGAFTYLEILTSVQIPKTNPKSNNYYSQEISELSYDSLSGNLFIRTDYNDLYRIRLKNYTKLSSNTDSLKAQVKNLKLRDLSIEEKKKFGIRN